MNDNAVLLYDKNKNKDYKDNAEECEVDLTRYTLFDLFGYSPRTNIVRGGI